VALGPKDFSGGEESVARKLRQLGIEVEVSGRNPTWSRDELILALDLYFTNPASPPSKDSAAVAELSDLLNKLHRLNSVTGTETLRNTNGVYMKMMNLRALDPTFVAQGKVGMQSGGALEKVIWAEYAGRRAELAKDAAAIRDAISKADEKTIAKLPSNDPYEGEEGGILFGLHRRYERDPRLIAEKKRSAKATGELACEVCGFHFGKRYGELGIDFIEVHHTKPVNQMQPGAKTKLSDLALLCSNCHRMAHRRKAPLTIEELRSIWNPS
jgi:5-methylcytosine-specific restriction protein A